MKSLTTLTTLVYSTTIKMISLTTLSTLFYFTTIKMKSLTTLTTLFYITTIKMKSLTTLTTLFYFTTTPFYFTTIKMTSLTAITMLFYLTTYPHYATLWLRSQRCFTSLFTLTTVLSSSKCFFPRNFSVFINLYVQRQEFQWSLAYFTTPIYEESRNGITFDIAKMRCYGTLGVGR